VPLDWPVTQDEIVSSLRNLVTDLHPDQSGFDDDLPASELLEGEGEPGGIGSA
jgi:hypothetical protein